MNCVPLFRLVCEREFFLRILLIVQHCVVIVLLVCALEVDDLVLISHLISFYSYEFSIRVVLERTCLGRFVVV